MRIGIMLRAFDEKGGVGVYARNVTKHLLQIGAQHRFFLYFSSARHPDEFAGYENATVRAVRAPGKALWDQLAMPYWFRRDRLDVIFHPKFTVPLACSARSVMVLHGAGWFIPETKRYWSAGTRLYARLMMPIYCRAAGAVLSVSNITRDVFIEKLGVSPAKIETVYFAPGAQFGLRASTAELDSVRARYGLPDRFILTLSGADRGDRKNFQAILAAFRSLHARHPVKLVVAGRGCEVFRERYGIPDDGYGQDIHFCGWVDQADLPAFYQMATLFLYPSNMEAFPIPITEALASGTPIVTSNIFGLQELAGEAAILVDPHDPSEIAAATLRLLDDENLRADLRIKAAERSKRFDWDVCARETLAVLERVGRG
jgi:glycosyltransferase involved in cell wall biosynthesis